MYDGYLWINNAVFDDSALLADVLYHEEAETDLLSGIAAPTETDHTEAHQKAQDAEAMFTLSRALGIEQNLDNYDKIIEMFGQKRVTDAVLNDPDNFAKFMLNINAMGYATFKAAVADLSEGIGTAVVANTFARNPAYFISAINNMYRQEDNVTKASTIIQYLFNKFGGIVQDTFVTKPFEFSQAVTILQHLDRKTFENLSVFLDESMQQSGESYIDMFYSNPAAFISQLQKDDLPDSSNDLGDLEVIFGSRDQVYKAFKNNVAIIKEIVDSINLSEELYKNADFKATVLNAVNIFGQETVSEICLNNPVDYSYALIALMIMPQDLASIKDAWGKMQAVFGGEEASEVFMKNPMEIVNALNILCQSTSEFNPGYDTLISSGIGQDSVLESFSAHPLGTVQIIGMVGAMGPEDFNTVVDWFGKEKIAWAFQKDPSGVYSLLDTVKKINIDTYLSLLDDLSLQYGKDKVIASIMPTTGLLHTNRFLRDGEEKSAAVKCLEDVLVSRITLKLDERPLAVIIYCAADWNGAFGEIDGYKDIEGIYQVMYFEAENEEQVFRYLSEATKDKPAQLLILDGHGMQTGIQFGSGNGENSYLDISDEAQLSKLRGAFVSNAAVILDSCSTGKGESGEDNVANMICRALQLEVWAPIDIEWGIRKIDCADETKNQRVTGVEFEYAAGMADKTYKAVPEKEGSIFVKSGYINIDSALLKQQQPGLVSYNGWLPGELAEFIDGAQGARTTGKTALPTAEQQAALETTAQNIVAPAYAELIGKEFDLDLSRVQIVTGTPLEDFTACMY
ncbi:MAG: hypothetical protein WBE75_07310, partial [Candidatus Omnitrophota bacterium]